MKATILKQINEMIAEYRVCKQDALKKNDSIGITIYQKLISEFSSFRNIIHSLPDEKNQEKCLKLYSWNTIAVKEPNGNLRKKTMQVIYVYSDYTVECELSPYTEELWETWVLLMKEVGKELKKK